MNLSSCAPAPLGSHGEKYYIKMSSIPISKYVYRLPFLAVTQCFMSTRTELEHSCYDFILSHCPVLCPYVTCTVHTSSASNLAMLGARNKYLVAHTTREWIGFSSLFALCPFS